MVSDNPSIVEEILYHCTQRGFRITEVPIVFVDRQKGKSKFSPALIGRWIMNLWQVRRMVKS
jgi:dolichol-phosphate mannosyltransferase